MYKSCTSNYSEAFNLRKIFMGKFNDGTAAVLHN